MNLSALLKKWLVDNALVLANASDDEFRNAAKSAISRGDLTAAKLEELGEDDAETYIRSIVADTLKGADPATVFGGARVKRPSERYSTTKSVGKHATTGQIVRDEHGKAVELPSELENAKAGALCKMLARKAGLPVELNEHEKGLVEECFNDDWCGEIGGEPQKSIPGGRVKALINDSTSGGADAVPIWWDNNLVTFSLLHSQLMPYVDTVEVSRGSSVEGASIGNPTVTWGTNEGTAVSTFDTAGLVAGVDTPIHRVTCAVEVGREWLSDTPSDAGRRLTENIGQSLLASIDNCIANGAGSQPEGLFNASGITDIGNPAAGAGGAWAVTDVEELLFSVPKQYREANLNPCYVMNDTTYSRIRGISVGAADARRVFGMQEEEYKLFGHRALIQNDIANNLAAFLCMKKYRLYRRQGFSVRWEFGGKELSLKNLGLLLAVGRFGGKIVDANAVAFGDNFQA